MRFAPSLGYCHGKTPKGSAIARLWIQIKCSNSNGNELRKEKPYMFINNFTSLAEWYGGKNERNLDTRRTAGIRMHITTDFSPFWYTTQVLDQLTMITAFNSFLMFNLSMLIFLYAWKKITHICIFCIFIIDITTYK